MNFKQKKTKKKWLPIAIVVIVIASTFMWSDFLVLEINNILLPIRLKTYKTTVGIQDSINSFLNINTISEKNKELELTLAKQIYISVANKNLLEENKKLRELLDIKEKNEYKTIVSQIIYMDSLNPYETITIDKGKNDGIAHNMSVISTLGLVGRIKEVFDDYSIVELITSTKSHTSAIDDNEKSLSILSGQGNDVLSLEYIAVDKDVKVGDKIHTSGMSNIYMKNISLGTITSVDNSDEMFKEITVKLPYNIFNLKNVMVIKKEN
jgi:rod shape-determining protein MreC